jgi:hypothetical protein
VSALEGAVAEEGSASEPSMFTPPAPEPAQQAAVPSAPQGESAPTGAAPSEPAAPAQPAEPAAPVDTFDGGMFNPDTLPAELQPAWKQLQAAFVQKTQTLADQRKQLESLGDVNDLASAAQLYQQIQNPDNWPKLQQELGELMQQRGLAPTAPFAAPAASPADPGLAELADYPELAPVVNNLQAMQQRMEAMGRSLDERINSFQREQAEAATAGEFARQEAVLLAQGRNEPDMERINKLSLSHGGNLLAAANEFDAWKSQVLGEYLAGKQSPSTTAVAPIPGGASASTIPARPKTLEEATDLAIETLKAHGLDSLDF